MKKNLINNKFYEEYGERWYDDDCDPVALLRVEGKFKNHWIREFLEGSHFKILDLGCGGGFLSNALAIDGHNVFGVDLSPKSLVVAEDHDQTHRVHYVKADVCHLPFPDQSFDVVCAMDLLEHVEDPELLVQEAQRVLKPNGVFFFHTFNRNPFSHFIIIKLIEWLVPNTPKNMHVIDYFIKPNELISMMSKKGMHVQEVRGIKPIIWCWPIWKSIFTRKIQPGIRFEWTSSLLASYAGYARNTVFP